MQPEEHVTLAKKGCLGRVYVLCAFGIALQNTTAESNDFAHVVANRKHDPSTEAVVDTSMFDVRCLMFDVRFCFIFLGHKSALNQDLIRVAARLRPIAQSLPFIRRVPELPILRYPTIDPTLL